ncbi:MAG TPA: PAS domain S-box protein [Chitinophagaceae bacterium]|nr:PAS domain S-box protein [Chitinophagaceae bacterium]
MISSIQKAVLLLPHARQFYNVVTDRTGRVLAANGPAREHLLTDQGTRFPSLEEIRGSGGTWIHGREGGTYRVLSWEVEEVPDGTCQWIAQAKTARSHKIASRKDDHLQRSELFYRSIIADAHDGMLVTDAEGTITFLSPAAEAILGFPATEVLGRNCFGFVHPEDLLTAAKAFHDRREWRPELEVVAVRLRRKGAGWLPCMLRGHNLLQNPHVSGMVIYFHDDTLRKSAEDALRESEQRFRHLIRHLQVGVVVLHPSGSVLMHNKAVLDLLGITEGEVPETNVFELIEEFVNEDGSLMTMEEQPLVRALQTGRPVKDVVVGIRTAKLPERTWLLVNTDLVLSEEGIPTSLICSVIDITERKKQQEKQFQDRIIQQKLLTQATIDAQEKERREIGKELHDNIGQHLTSTKLFLDMARSAAEGTTAEMLALALRNINEIINEVRSISRSLVPPTLTDLGLIECIRDLAETTRRTHAVRVEISAEGFRESDFPENLKLMLFRIIQEQLNSILRHADAAYVLVRLTARPEGLVLEIEDNGTGFEARKKASGGELANIRNRAGLFEGIVDLLPAPGGGSRLRVSLPA